MEGILEIKCPYSVRNSTVEEACNSTSFYCRKDTDGIHLHQKHNYHYQVQGQMAVLGVEWCDFVVWTLKDFTVERISFDPEFWKNQCLPQLLSFYTNVMLPDLVYPRYPDPPHNCKSSNLSEYFTSLVAHDSAATAREP